MSTLDQPELGSSGGKNARHFEEIEMALPCMSYMGHRIIASNLVATVLWHRFIILEPPIGSFSKDSVIPDLFWDKLHLDTLIYVIFI